MTDPISSRLKAGSQYTQRVALWGVVARFYARMDLSSIPATTLRPCRVNVCVYCEPTLRCDHLTVKCPQGCDHLTVKCPQGCDHLTVKCPQGWVCIAYSLPISSFHGNVRVKWSHCLRTKQRVPCDIPCVKLGSEYNAGALP